MLRRAAMLMAHAAGGGAFTGTSLLLHGNGTNGSTSIIDSSSSPKTITLAGNTQITTTAPKWGTGAILMDGNGDYLDVPGQAFGTGDFTVEHFTRFTSFASNPGIWDNRLSSPAAGIGLFSPSGAPTLQLWAAGAYRGSPTASLSAAVYYHFAVCRAAAVTRFFLEGVQQGADYADTNNYNHTTLRFGANLVGGNSLAGRFDDIRVTLGVGLYTANFTPPAAEFSDS